MAKEVKLKRALGLLETTFCGVGIILGAGIYVLIGEAAGMGGNTVWISFLIAAFVAALTGLSFAELSSMFPKAGAAYYYAKKGISRRWGFIVGWLIIAGGVVSAAAVSLGFAGYFHAIFGFNIVPVAIGLIVVSSVVLFSGIKESALIGTIFAMVEAGGLIAIILIGLPYVGSVSYLEFSTVGFNGIFGAATLIFFAYLGFEDIPPLAEETNQPTRIIPKAILLSIIITTVIYVFVAISAVSIMGWEALGASKAPLADVAAAVLGPNAFFVISVIALFATANTVLLLILAASRITYGMADTHGLPKFLSRVHPKTRTPWAAIFMISGLSLFFVFIGDIGTVANITNFTVFVTFLIINAALIFLRYRSPKTERPFRVPFSVGRFPVLPALAIVVTVFMIFNIQMKVLLFGSFLLVLGFIVGELLNKRGIFDHMMD